MGLHPTGVRGPKVTESPEATTKHASNEEFGDSPMRVGNEEAREAALQVALTATTVGAS